MKPIWKYTIGLVVEVVIKVLQQLIDNKNPVIKGTGSQSAKSK